MGECIKRKKTQFSLSLFSAVGQTWTVMGSLPLAPQASVSTNSTTTAWSLAERPKFSIIRYACKGVRIVFYKKSEKKSLLWKYDFFLREGTQLGVAKAARFPPCTLLYVGRRFIVFHIVFPHVDAGGQHLATCCLVRMVLEWWRSPLYWFEQKENAAQGAA